MKTLPFSARLTQDDVEYINQLQIEGAHTASDKLRYLLAELRQQQASHRDFAANLKQWQHRLAPMIAQLLHLQHRLEQSNPILHVWLQTQVELLASLQTWVAQADSVTTATTLQRQQQLCEKILYQNALLLPELYPQAMPSIALQQSLQRLHVLWSAHAASHIDDHKEKNHE